MRDAFERCLVVTRFYAMLLGLEMIYAELLICDKQLKCLLFLGSRERPTRKVLALSWVTTPRCLCPATKHPLLALARGGVRRDPESLLRTPNLRHHWTSLGCSGGSRALPNSDATLWAVRYAPVGGYP